MDQFDVFLSYHWRDHEAVERLASWLRQEAHLRPFLDRWYLAPGQRWQAKLEEVLGSCRAVAVCIGSGDMGPWQQREKDLALHRQTREATFPVIPVLLPGCDPVLGFLAQNTWVDLRGGVTDGLRLQALAKAVRGEPPGAQLRDDVAAAKARICPYRGLRYFREEDAEFFFGREVASKTLAQAVARSPFVAVAGASGSGKSSVVRAGLLPLLRHGFGDRTWEMVTLVPSARPLQQLAAALLPLLEPAMTEVDRLTEVGKLAQRLRNSAPGVSLHNVARRVLDKQPGTDRLVIVVDQWEELYTLTKDETVRDRFIEELLAATTADGDLVRVVLTLRGDFFGEALKHRPLSDRLEGNLVHLGPMTEPELREAITQPARYVGLDFEPGLPEQLLRDVAGQPGNLPLLEYALEQLWKSRQGRLLTHDSYKDMEGLQGALAKRAENLLEQLSPVEREAVERIFLQLVRVGSGSADTRRRAAIAEIGAPARPLLERLASERLVVTGRDDATGQETAEVAHEALIRGWKRLREWVDADREFLLWQERLRTEIQTWRRLAANEREVALLHGPLLSEAEQWLAKRGERLSAGERDFIRESRLVSEREEQERRGRERVLAEALQQRAEQAEARRKAEEQRAAEAERAKHAEEQRAAAAQARAEAERQRAEEAEARRHAEEERALQAESSARIQRWAAVILSILALLAIGLGSFAALQWRSSLAQKLAAQAVASQDNRLALLLAVESVDVASTPETKSALLTVLERQHFVPRTLGRRGPARIESIAYTGDGTRLGALEVVGGVDPDSGSGSIPNATITVWDAATRSPSELLAAPAATRGVAATENGWLAAVLEDGKASVWDSVKQSQQRVPDGVGTVATIALSPERSELMVGGKDVRQWRFGTQNVSKLFSLGNEVRSVGVSPDGGLVAAVGTNGTITVWDVGRGRQRGQFHVGHGDVRSMALDTGGTLALVNYAADPDGQITLWDVDSGTPLGGTIPGGDRKAISLAFARDGRTLAAGDSDGTITIWDMDVRSWQRRACRMVDEGERNLTDAERVQYLGIARVVYGSACRCAGETGDVKAGAPEGPAAADGMKKVPAGKFWMGCKDGRWVAEKDRDTECLLYEKPGRWVYVDDFSIDTTEVTVTQYGECVKAGKCTEPLTDEGCNWGQPGRGKHPINCVKWSQAKTYCESAGKRLPTEAEWEKAARGPNARIYPWGNDWSESKANAATRRSTMPVGYYDLGASPYGALDMAGNVMEWVWDNTDRGRGLRGGTCYGNWRREARASARLSIVTNSCGSILGFRCAR